MSTYTKEQLIARINQVTAINKYRISRDPDADGLAMDNELLAIALASLEAEAVAYIRAAHNPDGFCFADGIHPAHRHQKLPLSTLQDGCYWTVTPLYTAPPEPVSVPDAYIRDERGRMMLNGKPEPRIGYGGGWNACRAAMLQGADGNSPVISNGWVACSERMPKKGQEVLCTDQFENYETALYNTGYIPGPPFFATTAGEFHPTHWMPMPAAPQQEVK